MIPFLNLNDTNKKFLKIFKKKFSSFILKENYILGNEVIKFEENFAKYCGTKHAIGVGNGFDALYLILKALNIKKNDEVIVPANTYIATWLSVTKCGAKIVPVEPNEKNYNIDPNLILSKINKKTKAIICVHLYGYLCDMNSLKKISNKHKLFLIEDASQAHGAKINKFRAGALSDAAAFSLYPTKNLGALGDAGIITTNNKKLFNKISYLRNYGSLKKNFFKYQGINSRLDSLQALFLNIKLKSLDRDNKLRQNLAARYIKNLKGINHIILPKFNNKLSHVFHLFVIKTKNRKNLMKFLKKKRIGFSINYPIPPHKQEAFSKEKFDNKFKITNKLSSEIISLPMNTSLKLVQVDKICSEIKRFYLKKDIRKNSS